MNELTTFEDIIAAARTLYGHSITTPLLTNKVLDDLLGARVLIKCENLQLTGSFKFRGAFNKVSQATKTKNTKSFVAWSSGNHAQAVAAATSMVGGKAYIVMPSDAPQVKISGTKYYGAEITFYDRNTEIREEIGKQIANEKDASIIPPYDDRYVIAGQGTVGLELCAQALSIDETPDLALIPCGGGGLIAGCGIALRRQFPNILIHPVEPEGFNDTARSLELGKRVQNKVGHSSTCDSLLAPTPGELTFKINSRILSPGKTVTNDEIALAMSFSINHLKLCTEPGGVAALASLLSDRDSYKGKTVVLVLSGGNVDPSTLQFSLSSNLP